MEQEKKALKIVSCSDIHYFSPKLNDKGALFKKTMNTADGKHTIYIEEIVDAFLEEVRKIRPDFLLVSGDLTFNGEKLSHLELAAKFKKLKEEARVQTLVIPGNHDVDFAFPYGYKCDSFYPVENISAQEFKSIYKQCGYDTCLSRDPSSLSYIYPLAEDIWLFCLDSNANGDKGQISPATMEWLKVWLAYAKRHGKIILTMTHQHILSHNLLTSPGYELFNARDLYDLLVRNNATLNYSGHMHIQHVKSLGKFSTISQGSLAVSPNLYGVTTISPERTIDYQAHQTDVQGWARAHHIKDHTLRDFSHQSLQYFNAVWGMQVNQELNEYNIPPLERVGLVDFAVRVINAYLSGQTYLYRSQFLEDPLYKKWQEKAGGSYFQAYIASILEDPANSTPDDQLHIRANRNDYKKAGCPC